MQTYYQATELPLRGPYEAQKQRSSANFIYAVAALVACLVALVTYEMTARARISSFVVSFLPRVNSVVRSAPLNAGRSPFSFGKKEEEEPPARPSFFGSPASTTQSKTVKNRPAVDAIENVGRISGVGAKVVSELALYLAFNTAYFVTNTYQFLTKEEQQKLARQTVDKQLPELLALLGGTTETLGKTAQTVASTQEYQEITSAAAKAAEELTKGLKTENTPNPEVIEKLKKIVSDEKGAVMTEETKTAMAETLKKGGIKSAELSLYLFYNIFSVLRNLDKVLPTTEQSGSIEGKIQDLENSVLNLATEVKQLPAKASTLADKVEEIKESIPTAEDIANLDPAEVSLSVRSSLANTKTALDNVVDSINKALQKDSEFRKSLEDAGQKLQPVTNAVAKLVEKLPLPKNPDGSVDYSKLLADTGIITLKGVKALIEATKKAAASVNSKTLTGSD